MDVEVSDQKALYVVDEDQEIRRSIADLAASLGLLPVCFASAEDFLAGYDRSATGCLIMDVCLPGMSGMELQRCLAEDGISLSVIVVTRYGDVATCAEAMKRGAIDFLEKPIRPFQLRDSIQRALQIAESRYHEIVSRERLSNMLGQLAPNELAVLKELLLGQQNKEIAATLDISLRTVQLRRSGIMRKLGVTSMLELCSLLKPVWRGEFDLV